jgi:hypothetical protein
VEGEEGLTIAHIDPRMTAPSIENFILRLTGLAGAAIFAIFFMLTFSTPQWVERVAADFIEARVSERVKSGIDSLRLSPGGSALSRVAENLYRRKAAQIEVLKQQLEAGVRERWAAALAQVRDLSCECRAAIAQAFELGAVLQLQTLEAAEQKLVHYIQSSYMDVAVELKRDIRIFTATNAASFLVLLVISFLKPQAVRHLFLPGLLLAAATIFCAYLYVFAQNWLLTIIYGDYEGVAYLGYLGAVFLFFCDIALNRGRVTSTLVNGVADSVGSAFTLVPC